MISNFQKFPHLTAAQVQPWQSAAPGPETTVSRPQVSPNMGPSFSGPVNTSETSTNRRPSNSWQVEPTRVVPPRAVPFRSVPQQGGTSQWETPQWGNQRSASVPGTPQSGTPLGGPSLARLSAALTNSNLRTATPTFQPPPGTGQIVGAPAYYEDPAQDEYPEDWTGGEPQGTVPEEKPHKDPDPEPQNIFSKLHRLASRFSREGLSLRDRLAKETGISYSWPGGDQKTEVTTFTPGGERAQHDTTTSYGKPVDPAKKEAYIESCMNAGGTRAACEEEARQELEGTQNDTGQIIRPLASTTADKQKEFEDCMAQGGSYADCMAQTNGEEQLGGEQETDQGAQKEYTPEQIPYPWPSLKRAEGYMPGVGGINFEDPYLTDSGKVNAALEEAINAGNNDYWSGQEKAITTQLLNQGNTAMARLASSMAARGLGASGANLQGMAETTGATQNALGQALAQLAARRAQTDIARLGELGRLRHSLGGEALQKQGLEYGTKMQAAGLEADLQNQDFQQQMQDYYALLNAIQTVMNARQQGADEGSSLTYLANALI